MLLSRIFLGMVACSLVFALINGQGHTLSKAMLDGAQSAFTVCLSMSGAICLWTGLGNVMEKAGITGCISRILRPILHRLFPESKTDAVLAGHISANICANVLGLGNAATPMGIRAVQRMALYTSSGMASDSMCRLIVLNTASIQLIPATVAAVRASLGSAAPFDILPAVWITSLFSASMGVCAAILLGKADRHD